MNDTRKSLKQAYRDYKPPMGIVRIRVPGGCYLLAARDTKAAMNKHRFQLENRCHGNRTLQQAWREHGGEMEVVEELSYQEDETQSGYDEQLQTLLELWLEKQEGAEVLK